MSGANTKTSHLAAAGDTREGTGLLCTDASGLCLAAEGVSTPNADQAAGVYSNLTRLASKLQGGGSATPLFTIETDESSTLVKSYDGGHTVALTVPNIQQDAVEAISTTRQDSGGGLSEQPSSSVEGEEAASS